MSVSVLSGRSLEKQEGQISVRFLEDVLASKEMERIYGEMKEDEKKNIRWFTLWKQTQGETVSRQDGKKNITVRAVEIWGDAEQIYPDCLADGNTLYREDAAGCMLSKKAAFALFGGEEVLGKKVFFKEKGYEVRGLLDVEEELFLVETKDALFSCMEVTGNPKSGTEPVRQFLLLSGASLEDGAILEWDSVRGLMHMICLLAFGILEIAVVCMTAQKYKGRKYVLRCIRGAAIVVFFLLFTKSFCFSQDYIPSKWSDFDFFQELVWQQKENYMRYLDIPDILKDRELFGNLHRVSGLALISVLCAVWSFFKIERKPELPLLPYKKENL